MRNCSKLLPEPGRTITLGPEGMLAHEASSNPAGKASKIRILDMVYIPVIARVIESRVAELLDPAFRQL
jgi:hypothetical protein